MSLADFILRPLELPYQAIVRLRNRAYQSGLFRQKRIDGIVISVGNLTVGGTGKTPMVLWIAERLVAEGKSVAILTRGYRGKPASSAANQPGGSLPDSASDEVRMLKGRLGESVAFGVGADRFAKGHELSKRGIKWFVLDDGFQHRQVARDVDIVLIDATTPFGGGRLLPAGRLREPRSALARADAIVITRSDHAPAVEAAVRHDSAAPIFYAKPVLSSIGLVDDLSASEIAMADIRGKKFFAFCGIGNPAAFFANLPEWGFQLVGFRPFRDHHRYTQQDAAEIEAEARRLSADALICTEKDVFNLEGVRWQTLRAFFCRISLHVVREDEFWRAIVAKAELARRI